MNVLQLISKRLYQGERVIAIVTFISMMLIMFIQVFFRYVVQSSLAWSEEAMRYLFVITSYFGAACATYEHKHVVVQKPMTKLFFLRLSVPLMYKLQASLHPF